MSFGGLRNRGFRSAELYEVESEKSVMCNCWVLDLVSGESFAAGDRGFQDLPFEMIEKIYSPMNLKERREARVNRLTDYVAVDLNKGEIGIGGSKFKEKLAKIEELLELDQFISLSDMPNHLSPTDAISHIGVSQELWFEVMGNNPSEFKKERYCPDGPGKHKFGSVFKQDGTIEYVPMCPDLPVESVQAENSGNRYSDEEFIDRLNKAFELARKNIRFRRARAEEYNWADTEGGKNPKRLNSHLWKYATYLEISNLDPTQDPALNRRLYSNENQTHGVKAKEGNTFGFKRSGVWEWTENMIEGSSDVIIVGGSWRHDRKYALSGSQSCNLPHRRNAHVGAARLVRTHRL